MAFLTFGTILVFSSCFAHPFLGWPDHGTLMQQLILVVQVLD